MDEKPTRRWFRFRLSTVLVLTAITAWAMACKPYMDWGYDGTADFYVSRASFSVGLNEALGDWDDELADNICLGFALMGPGTHSSWWMGVGPKKVLFPASALAAFVAWKAVWAVVERWRRRPAATSFT